MTKKKMALYAVTLVSACKMLLRYTRNYICKMHQMQRQYDRGLDTIALARGCKRTKRCCTLGFTVFGAMPSPGQGIHATTSGGRLATGGDRSIFPVTLSYCDILLRIYRWYFGLSANMEYCRTADCSASGCRDAATSSFLLDDRDMTTLFSVSNDKGSRPCKVRPECSIDRHNRQAMTEQPEKPQSKPDISS